MSRRLRITDESYGGDRASFRGSQFFLRREREYSARIPRLQFSDDVIFRIGVSLSRSMLIGWKKKKDSTRESRIVPGGIFFARGIALLSITDATRMRSTHAHARAIRVGSFHARLSLWNARITKRYDTRILEPTPAQTHPS